MSEPTLYERLGGVYAIAAEQEHLGNLATTGSESIEDIEREGRASPTLSRSDPE